MPSSHLRHGLSIAILALALVGWTHGGGGPEPLLADASLRAAPSGEVLWGMLAAGSPVTVLDERDGWTLVRVEGWIPAAAVGPRSRSEEAPFPTTPPPGAVAKPSRGVALEGTLSVRVGKRKRVSGERSPVLLLPSGFQPRRDQGESEILSRVADLEAEAERLAREATAAGDLPSFSEAMRKRDALLERRDGVLAVRGELLARVHARHEAQAREVALASTVTDGQGHYVLLSLPPGSYTLYGRVSRDRVEVEWLVPVSLGDAGGRVDLDETRAMDHGATRDAESAP